MSDLSKVSDDELMKIANIQNVSDDELMKIAGVGSKTSAQPVPFAPPRSAVVTAEGANKGITNMLGMPVDLLTMGLNSMGSLVGLPPIEDPIGGSKWIGNYMPQQTVKPEGLVENVLSATGEQIPYAMTGGIGQIGKGASLTRQALQLARPTVGAGIGVGTAREVMPDSPMAEMAGALVGSATPMLTKPLMSWMQPQGKRLVESAMKIPPRSVSKEIRDQAVNTIIEKDIPFTEKGLSKVSGLLDDVNKEIDGVIKAMPQTKTVTETVKGVKQFTPVIEKYPQGAGYTIKTGPKQYIMDHGAPRIFRNEAEAKPLLDNLISKLPSDQPSTITREMGTIDMGAVSKRIDDLKGFYEKLGPEISKEFLKPLNRLQHKIASQGFITPVEAQEMKKTLYALNRKHYGELKTAQTEGYKAVARGLKEELVKQNPELATLNKNSAELINLETLLEKSLNRVRNYDVIQLGDTIMATAGGVIGGYPGAALSATLKKVIEMPRMKVALGKALAKARQKPIPVPFSRAAIATGAAQNAYKGNYNE
jgi:hypothetical protein